MTLLALFQPVGAQDWARTDIVPKLEHAGAVQSLAFLADDIRVVSASDDNTIKLWTPRREL